jgi:hypothetical protein
MLKIVQRKFLNFLEQIGDESLLFHCRLICKLWNNYIFSRNIIKDYAATQKNIRNLLWYDDKVYDEFYYKRMILCNKLCGLDDEYKQLMIPDIQQYISDLDDDESMQFVIEKPLPLDIRIFLCEYFHSPNVIAHLYSPDFIRKVSELQSALLRTYLIDSMDIDKLILFTPICYSKHYRMRVKDQSFINVLCYINIIDVCLESEFPSMDERYIVFELPLVNLKDKVMHQEELQKFLLRKSQSVALNPDEMMEIIQNIQSINNSFDTILKNHYYNL